MGKQILAKFTDGVLVPTSTAELKDGMCYQLEPVVEEARVEETSASYLAMMRVFGSISPDAAREFDIDIEREFGQIDPSDRE